MRDECDKLQKVNTQMKDDTVKHEQDMNKQMDQLVRQGVSLQRVIIDLEDETESLRKEMTRQQEYQLTTPKKYLEWYNAWMDTMHGLYVLYVAGMSTQTDLAKAGIKPTVSIDGGMSYIKRENDSTRRKWRL